MGAIDDLVTSKLKVSDAKIALRQRITRSVVSAPEWCNDVNGVLLTYSERAMREDPGYLPAQASLLETVQQQLQESLSSMYVQYQLKVEQTGALHQSVQYTSRGFMRFVMNVSSRLHGDGAYAQCFLNAINRSIEKREACFQSADLVRQGNGFFTARIVDDPIQRQALERCRESTKDIADLYTNMGRTHERVARRYAEMMDILR